MNFDPIPGFRKSPNATLIPLSVAAEILLLISDVGLL